ncbi:MAG: P-loop NTPase fold protein [Bacteroidota bacterium]
MAQKYEDPNPFPNVSKKDFDEIRRLIGEAKQKEAINRSLELVTQMLKSQPEDEKLRLREEEILAIEERHDRLVSNQLKGILDFEESNIQINRLNRDTLVFTDLLYNIYITPENKGIQSPKQKIQTELEDNDSLSGRQISSLNENFEVEILISMVANGKTEEALKAFLEGLESLRDEYSSNMELEGIYFDIVELNNRWNNLKREGRIGIISEKDRVNRENRIVNNLLLKLRLMNDLEEKFNFTSSKANSETISNTSVGAPNFEASPYIKSRLHADHWAEKDLLGYQRYAHNIHKIISEKKAEPPLTIGIIAPWGQGKTTLMRYIEGRFNNQAIVKQTSDFMKGEAEKRSHSSSSKGKFKKWIDNSTFQLSQQLPYPSVWFNPWKYQSSSQIWSGMAHAIIHQLVEKLPTGLREEFWFKLNIKRIDKEAIRRDLIRDIILKHIPTIILSILLLLLTFIGNLIVPNNLWIVIGTPLALIGPLGAGILNGVRSFYKGMTEKLNTYAKSPTYEDKLGEFHDINEDLQLVFDLVVDDDHPALIFIDDLDRIAPSKVVDVIEAINLMMNANFKHKCFFFLGMDAEMVAASIDKAYSNMSKSLPGKVDKFGSVGWYFLDKFIQLPFLIPTLSEQKKKYLVTQLFDDKKEEVAPTEIDIENLVKGYFQDPSARNFEVLQTVTDQQTRVRIEEAVLDVGLDDSIQEAGIKEKVGKYAAYLDPSPRSIKRFANMLRFHSSLQKLREFKSQGQVNFEGDIEDNSKFADMDTLAIWLIITLRWPRLVRWLQWEQEENFDRHLSHKVEVNFAARDTIDKARFLDTIIRETKWAYEDGKKGNQHSLSTMEGQWEKLYSQNQHLPWLKDKELVKLFYEEFNEDNRLEQAFLCGVW